MNERLQSTQTSRKSGLTMSHCHSDGAGEAPKIFKPAPSVLLM